MVVARAARGRAGGAARRPPASRQVDERDRGVADREPLGAGHRVGRAHHLVDDPRLAANLGREPAREQRDEGQRRGSDDAPDRTSGDSGKRRRRIRTHRYRHAEQREPGADERPSSGTRTAPSSPAAGRPAGPCRGPARSRAGVVREEREQVAGSRCRTRPRRPVVPARGGARARPRSSVRAPRTRRA